MIGKLFREREVQVVGETFEPAKRGLGARERLRGRLNILTKDSSEIADAAHLGTAFIGYEAYAPETLLQITRARFRHASGRGGDDLEIDVG